MLNGVPKPEPSQSPQMPPGTVKKIVFGVIVLALLGIGSTMFYTVQEQEKAAILTFGKYTGESEAGLSFKWPYPIQEVIKVPAKLTQKIQIGYRQEGKISNSIDDESMMITGDENIVSADAVVTWRISNIHDYLYNIDDSEKFLRNSASSAIRSVIGASKLDYAITDGKTEIQGKVYEKLVELHQKYETGIQIVDLKFQDIEPPGGEVEEAFREVTNAREEKNTKINNATKYENDRIPKARGEAQALLENAEAQKQSRILNAQGDVAKFNALYTQYVVNPTVTESRLILETLEKIMPNAKIFITDSSGDTVKYMPLNELMRGNGGAAGTTVKPNTGSAGTQGGTP